MRNGIIDESADSEADETLHFDTQFHHPEEKKNHCCCEKKQPIYHDGILSRHPQKILCISPLVAEESLTLCRRISTINGNIWTGRYDMSCGCDGLSRRHFIRRLGRWCLMLPGGMVLTGLVQGVGTRKALASSNKTRETRISLTEYPDLQRPGGYAGVKVNKEPVMIFRDGDETFRAVSRVCTHRGCTVDWSPDKKTFVCPCHGSLYDGTGAVSRGPARRNLPILNAVFDRDGNAVVVEG